jgi:chemotaxis protein CheC
VLISDNQIDVFKELINIGAGRSASLLNELINAPIRLSIPNIWVEKVSVLKEKFVENIAENFSSVELNFEGSFLGLSQVVFPAESASTLISTLTGDDEEDIDEVRVGTLKEVSNILLNGVMGSIGNIMEERFEYAVPIYREDTIRNLIFSNENHDKIILYGEAHFEVDQHNIEGNFYVMFELSSFEKLKKCLDRLG